MVRKLAVGIGVVLAIGCTVAPMATRHAAGGATPGDMTAKAPEAKDIGPGSVRVVSPAEGATVTSLDLPVQVAISDFRITAAEAGKPSKPGQGHIHVMVDKMDMEHLTNVEVTDRFTISGLGLKPGPHTLYVELAGDDHRTLIHPVAVKIDYKPSKVQDLPTARALGTPEVAIVSPAEGATVPRKFVLKVSTRNLALSCAAEAKDNVEGMGHLHVFANQPGITDKPSALGTDPMAMIGMLSMPCTEDVPVNLTSWNAGPVTLSVLLAKNDHVHLDIKPAKVTVNLE